MNKINFSLIVKNHLKSLRSLNGNPKGIYWKDLLLFFIIPIIFSSLLAYNNISLKEIAGDLIKAVAIFAAFLFNLLAIINNAIKDLKKESDYK